jgi:hypothetical protein
MFAQLRQKNRPLDVVPLTFLLINNSYRQVILAYTLEIPIKVVICVSKLKFFTSSKPAQTWIILGIPVLFIIGSLMHFAYDWSGESTIVGIFAPVNESVWEHLKMTFWPMLIWWFVGYFILTKRSTISASQWFVSCTVAEIVCPLVIVSFYYNYTGAFGIESLILDIFSLFLGIASGQLMALHVYKYAKHTKSLFPFAIAILLFMALAFTVFTFYPPQIPLFMDSTTGKYGI